MKIVDWLCERDDGLAHLSVDERDATVSFSLLWMYFEARLVNTRASATSLKALVGRLEAENRPLNTQSIADCYEYFRQRYWDGNGPSGYFPGLKMSEEMAHEVLSTLAMPPTDRAKLEVCLLVVLRYRNNLFHGTKWLYGLEGQQANFEYAVQLLKAVIALDDERRSSKAP